MVLKEEQVLKWYQKTGWILLFAFGSLLVVFVIAFSFLTLHFMQEIKQGDGEALRERLNKNGNVAVAPSLQSIRNIIETNDDPFLGNPEAELVIVEFIDYKCPVCKEFSSILHRINSSFGDKVKIIIRDFPLESIHTDVSKLAYFANCADKQDKYLEAHDLIFLIQDEIPEYISDEYLIGLANRLELNVDELEVCINNRDTVFEVIKDFDDGMAGGVEGTPTFFVNGEKIQGLVSWESWKKYLEKI